MTRAASVVTTAGDNWCTGSVGGPDLYGEIDKRRGPGRGLGVDAGVYAGSSTSIQVFGGAAESVALHRSTVEAITIDADLASMPPMLSLPSGVGAGVLDGSGQAAVSVAADLLMVGEQARVSFLQASHLTPLGKTFYGVPRVQVTVDASFAP